MLSKPLQSTLTESLGSDVVSAQTLSGGDINDAHAIRLADGREYFLKSNRQAPPTLFPAEATGLRWLAEASALAIPDVIAVNEPDSSGPCFLVLELMAPVARVSDFDVRLGRGLARLHRFGSPSFGLDYDNFIGSIPQANSRDIQWSDFYRERRLAPMVRLARDRGHLDRRISSDFDRLFGFLEERVGPEEPPARLHGDLWGGNLHVAGDGSPALIDPAVYGGHREMDLAMMRLFGGFSSRVFDAYNEEYPLAPAASERVSLYQLYPLLVHVNLFGAGYVGSVRDALARYV